MSYQKAMKWNKKHPKGTRQPILMHTESGLTPIDCQDYYNLSNQQRAELLTAKN